MPTHSKEYQKELMANIRQIIVQKPNVSCRQVAEIMAKAEKPITKEYALKLINKIRVERINRYNTAAAKEAIARFEDLAAVINEELLKVKKETKLDVVKVMALNSIMKNAKLILDLQFDMGIFERKLGTLNSNIVNVGEILKMIEDAKRETKPNDAVPDKSAD
jgi:hypothetical protein